MVAIRLRHACALESHVAWSPPLCEDGLPIFQHLAMVVVEISLDNFDYERIWSFSVRWGCREHFVSGCWHSSGRDRGRYPRECWLSTLGVLHPGVPVMWHGHIRDLFPTVEGCMGSRLPNVTMLHWAQQK